MDKPSIGQIVSSLGSIISGVRGRSDVTIEGVAAVSNCTSSDISFAKDHSSIPKGAAPAALIVPVEFDGQLPSTTLIFSPNPRLAFLRVIARFFTPPLPFCGVHPTATIGEGVELASNVVIGPHCYIASGTSIGEGSVLFPNVTICCASVIGRYVRIGSGVVIGADGFGYERNENGELERFPHTGGVRIENHVEIGPNACIDRGTLGDTVICEGAKIDNLVHVAHNVRVGKRAVIIANAMLGGSVVVGDECWIAPSVTVMNKLKIGEGALVGIGSLVTKDVPNRATFMGSPALPQADYHKLRNGLKKLIS